MTSFPEDAANAIAQVDAGRGQGQVEPGLGGSELQPGAVGGPEDERRHRPRRRLPGGGDRHARVGAGDALAEATGRSGR